MSSNRSEKNVEGWAKAVDNLIQFRGEHNLHPATKNLLDKRVFLLSKNIINLYHQINDKKKPLPPLSNFFPAKMLFSKNTMLALKICSYRILVSAKRMQHNISDLNRD
ncbi:MAG: hypothetical protein EA391_01635 [Balneolaceae bacterium]|nr:MAG: hypothetical protein EA391_01635 [Balneolaceae bacterium]